MIEGGLGDLEVNTEQRVQRRHRILKDHRDPPTADMAHLARPFLCKLLAVKFDIAANDMGRRREKADDRQAVVVLPHPDSPTRPIVSPSCKVKLTPSTALITRDPP